ncbi:MAG: tetratricopeptide repeat protein [Chloroflexi bacterium]|nr:tetratricopeptide repeat protein [Chloroflexota bacterium]
MDELVNALLAYLPMDRRHALAAGDALPTQARGAALFADIAGFTPLTEALNRELGPQRGAEALTSHLNRVYDVLIDALHAYHGSVIGFSGDAITCWLDGDDGLQATACALAMQTAMRQFTAVALPSGGTLPLAMKVAVAAGSVRRLLVGDPAIQVIEVMAGATLDRLAAAEHQAERGEVVLDSATAAGLAGQVRVAAWRSAAGGAYAVAGDLITPVAPQSWPPLPAPLASETVRPWLLSAVYDRLRAGRGDFLAELRPAVALFLRFAGLDFAHDAAAGPALDGYIRWVQGIVASHGGTLIQVTTGDKGSYLYVAFGAPVAHEDNAARAVAAALALQTPPVPLAVFGRVQIGISAGRMRTGAYGGASRTYGVLGDDTNLAARLMQAAAPGEIIASVIARQAAGDRWAWVTLPPITVKGKRDPIAIYRCAGRRGPRPARRAPTRGGPVIGRDADLAVADARLAQALAGQGQVLAIVAEAGMGKSRLLTEVIARARERGATVATGECSAYGMRAGYSVWQAILRGLFGLSQRAGEADQVRATARRLRRYTPALVARLPLLGVVLGLAIPDTDLTAPFDAKLRKASLEALVVDWLRARAAAGPLVLAFEDCHWLDPLSHDLLEVVSRAIVNVPVLVLAAYRPFQAEHLQATRISGLPHYTEVQLAQLADEQAQEMVRLTLRRLYGLRPVAAKLVERATERAQGNPFYIEELLTYLHGRGADPADPRALDRPDLPTSLHSLVLSRIDRLSESQQSTLKLASVVGRQFAAATLWSSYPEIGGPDAVRADLDELVRLELTLPDAPEPDPSYLFKHTMTQEAAYDSLPYALRARLHERIGLYLETRDARAVDRLAFHFDRSDNVAKRREYLVKAGVAAQAAYANAAARDFLERALPWLPPVDRFEALLRLGQVAELVSRWDDAAERYGQALVIAGELGDRGAAARCRTAMGELLRRRSRFTEAAGWLAEARADFESLDDQAGVAQVLHYAGSMAAQQGHHERARDLYEESLAIRRALDDRPRIASLLSNLGIVARMQGDQAMARALHEEGLALRRTLGDRWAIANSLNNLGNVALDQGDLAEARARLEEAVVLHQETGDRWNHANALNNLGNVARAQGDRAAAAALYADSLAINAELGDRWALAYLFEDIGALAAVGGEPARALRLIGAATALREAMGAPRTTAEQARLDQSLALARLTLDPATQEQLAAEGAALTLDRAIDLAATADPPMPAPTLV